MSGPCCLIKADLSRVVVVTDQGAEQWTASDLSPGDAPTASILASRARTAADWIASLQGVRKKLGAVCLDVEDIRCRWIRATGTAAPILSAATRGLDQDWEHAVLPERVEPVLRDDSNASQKAGGAGAGGAGVAMLSVADALPRIFLDEIDKRGVRAGEVLSLWHAMARAWDDATDGRLVCVLLASGDGRLVWSWSRNGRLLAGGSAPLAQAHDPKREDKTEHNEPAEARSARRVSLDWLTWSVQLGLSPDLIIAVGETAGRVAGALGEQWEGVAISDVQSGDPLAQTMSRLTRSPGGSADDARAVLVGMTRRPTRSTRTSYRWGALALLALAAGAIGVGVRMSGSASSIRDAADTVMRDVRQRVSMRLPAAESQPDMELYLQQRIAQLQQGAKFKPPPDPAPIYEEIDRLLSIIEGLEGVEMLGLTLASTGQTCELQLKVPDTRTGEVFKKALLDLPMAVSWSEQRGISARGETEQTLIFRGQF